MGCITLTTDFGTADGYVAAMKGAMLSIAPSLTLVDVTHAIPPQDVARAAFVLWATMRTFPPTCVHLVVVDPGVGTARRALAVRTPWGTFVGPDNGVFSYVWLDAPPQQMVSLTNPAWWRDEVSRTFHGRDIFAPVAAHLAQGTPLEALGEPLTDPLRLPRPQMEAIPGGYRGALLSRDRFGNLITGIGRLRWDADGKLAWERLGWADGASLPPPMAARQTQVLVDGRPIGPLRRTYGEVAPGELLALVGSSGLLEIAVAHGSAAERLGAVQTVTLLT